MGSFNLQAKANRIDYMDSRSSAMVVAIGAVLTYLGGYPDISRYLLAGFLVLGGMTSLLMPLCRNYVDIVRIAQLILGVAMALSLLNSAGRYNQALNVFLVMLWVALPNVVYHGLHHGLDKDESLLRLATVGGLFYWTRALTSGGLQPTF